MPAASNATADRRLLLVHAHPDDETIGTGATMAKYAAQGAHVCLVSCTLGEEGEILLPDIGHLAADADDSLGAHRLEGTHGRDGRARGDRSSKVGRRRPIP